MSGAAVSVPAEERRALREAARAVLDAQSSAARVRARVDSGTASDPELWGLMVELGWPGVAVPEELGGVGYGLAELATLLEELGRHLSGTPLAPSAAVAAALLQAPATPRRDALVGALAGEGRRVAAALAAALGAGEGPRLVEAGGLRLEGDLGLVWAGAEADELLVVAHHDGGLATVLVAADSPGLEITPEEPVDRTRSLAAVRAQGVAVTAADLIAFEAGDPAPLLDFTALAIALDSLGGAEAVLAETVEYAGQRVQFERPIGSFQAVKHACADMFVAVEAARAATERAVAACAGEDRGAASAAASAAKAYCADAYAAVAGKGVQLHGGIGFTWESDIQLHLKRAKLNQQLAGSSSLHRRRTATLLFDR